MKKLFAVGAAAFAACIMLTGCGENDKSYSSDMEGGVYSSSEPETSAETEPETEKFTEFSTDAETTTNSRMGDIVDGVESAGDDILDGIGDAADDIMTGIDDAVGDTTED